MPTRSRAGELASEKARISSPHDKQSGSRSSAKASLAPTRPFAYSALISHSRNPTLSSDAATDGAAVEEDAAMTGKAAATTDCCCAKSLSSSMIASTAASASASVSILLSDCPLSSPNLLLPGERSGVPPRTAW